MSQVLDALTATRGLEQDRPVHHLRRERRLLRPPARAGAALVQGRRPAGRQVDDAAGGRILLRPEPQLPARRRHDQRHHPPLGHGPARADVRDLAVEQGRLGQLAGVRPHLDRDVPGAALRHHDEHDQPLASRRLRRPDELLRLRQPQRPGRAQAAGPEQLRPVRRPPALAAGRHRAGGRHSRCSRSRACAIRGRCPTSCT